MEERHIQAKLSVITGPTCSGKTEQLISLINRQKIAIEAYRRNGVVAGDISPEEIIIVTKAEGAEDSGEIYSHDNRRLVLPTIKLNKPQEILDLVTGDTKLVAIDNVHFLPAKETLAVVHELLTRGINVIVAGLDLDYEGKSFETTEVLIADAETVEKLRAICINCHQEANRSNKVILKDYSRGDHIIYEPMCRHCHNAVKDS